jgi:hypothetical protein
MKKKRQAKEFHKQALADQIEDPESRGVRTTPHKKARRKEDDAAAPVGIAPAQSSAILSLAREQQEDEAMEVARASLGTDTGTRFTSLQVCVE